MANETLFKVYKTGETVLAGSLAAIVPNHYHDDRYYTEEEINSQNRELEEIVNALDDKLTNTETGLIPTLESKHDDEIGQLGERVTNEVDTLNQRITTEVGTLNGTINTKVNTLDNKLTNKTNGLIPMLEKKHDEDIGDLRDELTDELNVFKGKTVSIALTSANWLGTESPFYQNINIPLATVNSKIDLQPTVQQIVDLQDEEVTLVTENDNGILKVWAIGYKPSKDYEIQATITEVATQ